MIQYQVTTWRTDGTRVVRKFANVKDAAKLAGWERDRGRRVLFEARIVVRKARRSDGRGIGLRRVRV